MTDELIDDLNKIKRDYGLTQDELEKHFKNNGNLQGYLFKCVVCGKHRLTVDCD